ncbi:MAG TPA: hypothetical protein VF281_01965 [Candidatus Saccharimonadales bacterium]
MLEIVALVVSVAFMIVSAAALLTMMLAYIVRGRKTQDDRDDYQKYSRLGKFFIWVATGLVVLIGISALVGYLMTPRVIVGSHSVVWGAIFCVFTCVFWWVNDRSRSK